MKTVRAGERPLPPSAQRHNRILNATRDHFFGGGIAPPSMVIPSKRGGGAESVGEFQWQHKLMVSANQLGFDDPKWTAILED
jgi:hypothetical protein